MEKTANGTFKITKCTKFSEPTVSTNQKRRKLTTCEKTKNIQKTKFKNFFTSCSPGLPKSGIKRKCDVLKNVDMPVVKKATTQSSVTNLKKIFESADTCTKPTSSSNHGWRQDSKKMKVDR